VNTDFRPFAGFKLATSAYAAIWGTGFLSYLVMPYLIGSVADGMGLGVDQAGLIGSVELLVVALSAFATVTAGVIVSLGYITEIWSYHGVFGTQAIVVALMLIPMSFLPEGDEARVALAPFLSGKLIASGGYEAMGKVVISTLLIVMALSVVVGWRINQKLRLASS
jgi:hypothetical protein